MKHLLLILALGLATVSQAQEFTYDFSVDNAPYVEFDDGLNAVNYSWDDPDAALPMGFNFFFFERMLDTWYLSSNFLGGTLMGEPDDTGNSPIFFPYGSDLIDIGYPQDSLISTITYKTTGWLPNRVFHLQYDNCGFYSEVAEFETAGNRVNFQVRMFEGSNDIEIHFGPHSIKDNEIAHDGAGGPVVLLVDSLNLDSGDLDYVWVVGGDTQDPVVTPYDQDEVDDFESLVLLEGNPEPNTIYRFSNTYVGIDGQELEPLVVYPNPTHGNTYLRTPQHLAGTPFQISSLTGALVQEGTLRPGTQVVQLGSLPAGMYHLQYTASQGVETHRIVVQ